MRLNRTLMERGREREREREGGRESNWAREKRERKNGQLAIELSVYSVIRQQVKKLSKIRCCCPTAEQQTNQQQSGGWGLKNPHSGPLFSSIFCNSRESNGQALLWLLLWGSTISIITPMSQASKWGQVQPPGQTPSAPKKVEVRCSW